MKAYRVTIYSQSGGQVLNCLVFAGDTKSALERAIHSLPHDAPCWGCFGWNVSVYEEKQAFIVRE